MSFRDLEVLDISGCWRISDSGLQLIGEYCTKIRKVNYMNKICAPLKYTPPKFFYIVAFTKIIK